MVFSNPFPLLLRHVIMKVFSVQLLLQALLPCAPRVQVFIAPPLPIKKSFIRAVYCLDLLPVGFLHLLGLARNSAILVSQTLAQVYVTSIHLAGHQTIPAPIA